MSRSMLESMVVVVGGLLLEQAPKVILLSDEQLEDYYAPALQNFKDIFMEGFEPPHNFKTLVMDHVRHYLDLRRKRFAL